MATMEKSQAVNGRSGARGVASILAIGTANPLNCVFQADFPDYYFRVTNSENETMLKDKFKRICEKSMVRKRHMHLTEEILKENPSFCEYDAPSLNARQDMKMLEFPKLGERAAMAAIKEWGQPKSDITHIVVNGTSGVHMPGADYQIIKSLGLNSSVKRVMLYHQGCFAGATVLRIAKDLAENNPGARVLIVCCEMTITTFRGPCKNDIANLLSQALFGDGAAAVVVGADGMLLSTEKPLFRLVSTFETILPGSDGAIEGFIREAGITLKLSPKVPQLIGDNIVTCLEDAFRPFGIRDWNSLFWVPLPGGAAILREIEAKVGLKTDKFRATWKMLSEYGNMSSVSLFFTLDEIRKKSLEEGKSTTGEGLEWGVLLGFGPGITVETVVLQSVPIN